MDLIFLAIRESGFSTPTKPEPVADEVPGKGPAPTISPIDSHSWKSQHWIKLNNAMSTTSGPLLKKIRESSNIKDLR
jgi:hypothetical protein